MSIKKRITEKNPRTGALPSEQTADNAGQKQGAAGSGMLESDKLIYQLVENNVSYAGEQFGENLRFNSETLTNVLYDNLYQLLGEKFQEEEFINWLVEELLKNGAIVKVQEPEQKDDGQKQSEPKEEVVYEIDDSAYTELQAKVEAAIELIKANRLNIFKLFSDVDGKIKSISESEDKRLSTDDSELLRRRDEQITDLIAKIQGNQDTIDEHIQVQEETREELEEKVDEIQKTMEDDIAERQKSLIQGKKLGDKIQKTLKEIGKAAEEKKPRKPKGDKPQKKPEAKIAATLVPKVVKKIAKVESTEEEQKKSIVKKTGTATEKLIGTIENPNKKKDDGGGIKAGVAKEGPKSLVKKPSSVVGKIGLKGGEKPQAKGKSIFRRMADAVRLKLPKRQVRGKKPFASGLFGFGKKKQSKVSPMKDFGRNAKNALKGKVKKGKPGKIGKFIARIRTIIKTIIKKLIRQRVKTRNKSVIKTKIRPVHKTTLKPVVKTVNKIFMRKKVTKTIKPLVKTRKQTRIRQTVRQRKLRIVKPTLKTKINTFIRPEIRPIVRQTNKTLVKRTNATLIKRTVTPIDRKIEQPIVKPTVLPTKIPIIKPLLRNVNTNVVRTFVKPVVKTRIKEIQKTTVKQTKSKTIQPIVKMGKPLPPIKQKPVAKNPPMGQMYPKIPPPSKKPGVVGKVIGGISGIIAKKKLRKELEKKQRLTWKDKFKMKIATLKMNLKKKISESFIGKTWRGMKKMAKGVGSVVGAVVGAAVMAGKAAKKTAKVFWKASGVVGNILKGGLSAIFGIGGKKKGKGKIKKAKALKKQKKVKLASVLSFTPHAIMAKLGFRAIKFVAKSIWKGIKKLIFKAASFFKRLFKLMGKFTNKVGNWMVRLGGGIKDKACKFIVQPLAAMMVTVFGFVGSVVMSPIKFLQWVIPAIFDRVLGAMSNIKQGVKNVLRSTWSIFKRILFNPITIAILIGLLFYFVIPKLLDWLSGGIEGIKNTLWPMLKSITSKIWGFLTGLWSIITTVGKFLFKVIDYITNPDGWIVKFVTWVIKAFLAIKSWINKMFEVAGKDSIDAMCMWLAGDTIGYVLHLLAGMVMSFWKWLKKKGVVKFAIGLVKGLLAVGKMIATIHITLAESLVRGGWALFRWLIDRIPGVGWVVKKFFGSGPANLGEVLSAFTAPWKRWWSALDGIFSDDEKEFEPGEQHEYMQEDPTKKNAEKATRARIAVRSLKMKGRPESNLKFLERLSSMNGYGHAGSLLTRIQNMNKLYQENSTQVEQYNEFITKTWEMGKGDDAVASEVLRQLLESPDLSQRLMSAFFYYNPQTGKTQMLRPAAYIGQFLDNIRKMMNDPERDDQEAFKTLIEAFDQLNKERSHVINNQGDIIADFAERIEKFNQEEKDVSKNGLVELREHLYKFNKGDLFDNISVRSSFNQIQKNDAKSRYVQSVTGNELGTNKLLKVEPLTTNVKKSGKLAMDSNGKIAKSEFELKMPPKPTPNQIGNVLLPEKMVPAPMPNPDTQKDSDGQSLYDKWWAHQAKRSEMINRGLDTDELNKMGYRAMTFDQFKQEYHKKNPPDAKMLEQMEENKKSRLSALRLARNIQAYHNQGEVANADGFNLGKNPSILKVETDGLEQTMYMFSPEWQRVQGASKLSDDELLLEIDSQDRAARERLRKAKEAEERKKKAEAERKRREQAILDYSAKVEGGFIEVKIGEDIVAMENAYAVHMKKRSKAINDGVDTDKLDAMGLKNYTWEEWKKYYRKMHGLPEDGIKRIPFEGKKKERQIDWSSRYPLSIEEMGKFGIEVSEDGPVMIPLDKAMEVANALLTGAKTVYSVRDGLEVMRKGLETESNKLKAQREGGQPVAVLQSTEEGAGEQTTAVPPGDQSTAQEQFENRF